MAVHHGLDTTKKSRASTQTATPAAVQKDMKKPASAVTEAGQRIITKSGKTDEDYHSDDDDSMAGIAGLRWNRLHHAQERQRNDHDLL
jgi:hypothetical protein